MRPVTPADEASVAAIIRAVMPEFGADGPGFALHDPEVDHMCAAYQRPGAAYFVVEEGGEVIGGGGVAPLDGVEGTCELRKMYFLPRARGRGLGEAMMRVCLAKARDLGYRACYLETLTGMEGAQRLYRRTGFRPICAPLGATGHHGCDKWFIMDLGEAP
ncbi:MAG TPA: GNAT family N-acetyltransferase [Holophaga sp.]|nr:GNAT family N-acetyltransferase [Holophaga sp.]